MHLTKLKTAEGKDIIINAEHIILMEPSKLNPNDETKLLLVNGDCITVPYNVNEIGTGKDRDTSPIANRQSIIWGVEKIIDEIAPDTETYARAMEKLKNLLS